MDQIIDLERYPLDRPGSADWTRLVERCRAELAGDGMYNLDGFLRPGVAEKAVGQIRPVMDREAFTHKRSHNIYFRREMPGLEPDHPALRQVETVSHTLCADQLQNSLVLTIYEYEPLAVFLAATMDKPVLYRMSDPLARANVMSYRDGEALNWHFDRSEFTTTLLLQAPLAGGQFEYRTDLRSDDNPNYAGVERLLAGLDPEVKALTAMPGVLNVFRGKNTAHRVTPVSGALDRMIAVFSFYERQNVTMNADEQVGFYGRAA
ncbi:HalD/BesD family halogenase [Radicibacter daui]|uniref:HalD/BesD family halogenase n=1 Tax=Radicibacter daui TaxID=3064829 RepID=UPI004046B3C7